VATIHQAIAAVDPGLPVSAIGTLQERVSTYFAQPRLIARLTSLFSLFSLILASIGLYGIIAYNVGRRTHEIGVRMALGAGRGRVVRLVLQDAGRLILLGLLIGLPLTFAVGRLLGSQLYGADSYNPIVILVAAATLVGSALVAIVLPA